MSQFKNNYNTNYFDELTINIFTEEIFEKNKKLFKLQGSGVWLLLTKYSKFVDLIEAIKFININEFVYVQQNALHRYIYNIKTLNNVINDINNIDNPINKLVVVFINNTPIIGSTNQITDIMMEQSLYVISVKK